MDEKLLHISDLGLIMIQNDVGVWKWQEGKSIQESHKRLGEIMLHSDLGSRIKLCIWKNGKEQYSFVTYKENSLNQMVYRHSNLEWFLL